MQLKRKIDSLKIFYIKNIKHIITFYQLYQSKAKNINITMISDTALIISKTHGKELNQ